MSDQLTVDADAAFNASRALSNDAQELREELARLAHEWRNLTHSWTGTAASAYAPLFDEWRDNAHELVESLDDSARRLAEAAARYQEQDTSAAARLEDTVSRMGL